MRFFVASWFFPPSTSSEGIVAYKLLRNSSHEYDVCSAISDQWGYSDSIEINAPNIRQFPVETDDLAEWVQQAVLIFEREHTIRPYDGIMTRSMPPESIDVAKAIKEKYPDLPWAASLGDPLSRVPWMNLVYIEENPDLNENEKFLIRTALNAPKFIDEEMIVDHPSVLEMAKYKNWEMFALKNADLLITPSEVQLSFMLCGMSDINAVTVHHPFDEELYPKCDNAEWVGDRVKMAFLGFANSERSLVPFIEALHILKVQNPEALENLDIRFIGNIADDSVSLIYNYYLTDVVSVEGNVSYTESLQIMQEADWLIHVDAFYGEFRTTGGSVYLAGKLADYIGARKPIFAITGKGSPADRLVNQVGGLTFGRGSKVSMANALERIAEGSICIEPNMQIGDKYRAVKLANELDVALVSMVHMETARFKRKTWPTVPLSSEQKILTICIPAYNVQRYLDRCLISLINSGVAEYLEIMVVNDGSTDATRDIGLAFEHQYPGIVKLVNKENGGHGSVINTGIELASGRYFKVLDGDDWLNPDDLNKLVKTLQDLECPVDLISSDYVQIYIDTGDIVPITKKSPDIEYGIIYELDSVSLREEYFSLGSSTYRTEVLRESGLKLLEHVFYDDVEYQMLPLPWVKTVMFLPGRIYHYAVGNCEQSISQSSFVKRYEDHDRVVKNVLLFYQNHKDDLSDSLNEYFEVLITDHLLHTHYTISLVFDQDRERGFRRAQAFDRFLSDQYPILYDQIASKYPGLEEARKHNFVPEKTKKTFDLKAKKPRRSKEIARSIVRKIMGGGIGAVVASEVKRHYIEENRGQTQF